MTPPQSSPDDYLQLHADIAADYVRVLTISRLTKAALTDFAAGLLAMMEIENDALRREVESSQLLVTHLEAFAQLASSSTPAIALAAAQHERFAPKVALVSRESIRIHAVQQAKRGGSRSHRGTHQMKERFFMWMDRNRNKHPSMKAALGALPSPVAMVSLKKGLSWCTEWAKKQNSTPSTPRRASS
jgi:hypothetical protein